MIDNRVGPPVRGESCFGRDKFVDLVWQKIEAGHVLLAAPRRFGKTSVMYRLIDAPRGNYKIVHADLEEFTEAGAFLTELVLKLADDDRFAGLVKGMSGLRKNIWSAFRNNFSEVEAYKFKVKLRDELKKDWQGVGEEMFKKLSAQPHPVLFILDEFPMMIDRMARSDAHREEAKTLLRWLRKLRLSPEIKNVHFLIAGSIGIGQVLNQLGEIAAINDFEQLRLEPFTPKVALQFLEALAANHKIELDAACQEKMLNLLGTLVPYFLQVLFSEVRKAYVQDEEAITPEKIERIYRDKVLGVDCKTYFDHYYGRLRDYYLPHEEKAIKMLLRELAVTNNLKRDTVYHLYRTERGEQADIEEFNTMMTNLENDFYIRFDGETQRYEFSCKLLRDWWLRHYALQIGN